MTPTKRKLWLIAAAISLAILAYWAWCDWASAAPLAAGRTVIISADLRSIEVLENA